MSAPRISVVAATRDRAQRLDALLRSLEAQTLDPSSFETVIVDEASTDETGDVLADAARRGVLDLRVVSRTEPGGPARARDDGWRAARGDLIAFTDDDCEASPEWLERGLEAWRIDRSRIVQGATGPIERETYKRSPFTRTIVVDSPGPPWETCNIFFPRAVLEAIDGFDVETYRVPGGEDTDLVWRALKRGATVEWVPAARVSHAVVDAGPMAMLRYAWERSPTVALFATHPDLRRKQLYAGRFWSPVHAHLIRALVALLLPRRLWPLAIWLALPYARRLAMRRTGPLLAPWIMLVDLVEVAAMLRGSLQHRLLVL